MNVTEEEQEATKLTLCAKITKMERGRLLEIIDYFFGYENGVKLVKQAIEDTEAKA